MINNHNISQWQEFVTHPKRLEEFVCEPYPKLFLPIGVFWWTSHKRRTRLARSLSRLHFEIHWSSSKINKFRNFPSGLRTSMLYSDAFQAFSRAGFRSGSFHNTLSVKQAKASKLLNSLSRTMSFCLETLFWNEHMAFCFSLQKADYIACVLISRLETSL